MNEYTKPPRVKIGGLWQGMTKTGIPYLSGKMSYGTRLEVWPNKKRKGDAGSKDPDYTIWLVEYTEKPNAQQTTQMAKNDFGFTTEIRSESPFDDASDVPF